MKQTAFLSSCAYLSHLIEESSGRITLGHVGLYVFIRLHEDERFIFPELSRQTGISSKTLHDYIKALEMLNLIERISDNTGVCFRIKSSEIHPSNFDYSKLPLSSSYTISINSISKSGEGKKNAVDLNLHEQIINDLNEVSGRSFKLNATDTIKKISWLISHGYTLDDFKKVHRAKLDWLTSTKMSPYYRPKTLYAQENFESYLNERKVVDPSKASTSKWNAPEKKERTTEHRKKLEERWNR